MKIELDTKELEDLVKKYDETKKFYPNDFYDYIAKNVAGRYLPRVIKRTPVESNESFKIKTIGGLISPVLVRGGRLRAGWTESSSVGQYIADLPVKHNGAVHEFTISNNVSYAPYVEYGHRQNIGQYVPYIGKTIGGIRQGARLKKAWVYGAFMMTNTNNEIKNMLPGITKKLIYEYLEKNFGIK